MTVPQENSDHLLDYEAVQLFADRAQRAQRRFSLENDHEHIVRICQLVEGLPLALEMAATWLKSLPCQAIADQIAHNLDFLTAPSRNVPDRHRSIRAVFGQSWQLLAARERDVFARLSVFRGGFTVEAAEHVAGATLANLTALAEKSLIRPETGQRYDIHDLLRQYADEKLGDDNNLHEAHATYFAYFLSQREEDLKGRRQKAALDEIAADHENVRVAWLWATQAHQYDLMHEMTPSVHLFFYMRDRLQEMGQLRTIALAHFQSQMDLTNPHLRRLIVRIGCNFATSDTRQPDNIVQDQIRQILPLVEQEGEQRLLASGLKALGHHDEAHSDFENAIHHYEQSLTHFQHLDDGFHMGWLLQRLGVCYAAMGQWDQATERSHRSLEISQGVGNQLHAARALYSLGSQALYRTLDLTLASHYLGEAISKQHVIENPLGIGLATVELGYIAFLQGDLDTATHLTTESLAIADRINRPEIYSAALALQALLANINSEDARGHNLALRSGDHTWIKYPTTIFWAQMALCMSVRGQKTTGEYQQIANELLKQAGQVQSPLLDACCLPFLALTFNDEQQPVRAVELLALASTQLSTASGWLEQWPPTAHLREQLGDQLGSKMFEKAWQRGTQSDLEITLAALSGDDGTVRKPQPDWLNHSASVNSKSSNSSRQTSPTATLLIAFTSRSAR